MIRSRHLHPSIPHGMTLIELLAALVLLSLVMGGMAAWLNLAAQGGRTVADYTRFESAAEAALERIFEDLMVGDVDVQESRQVQSVVTAWRDRVVVSDRTLRINTRDASGWPVDRVYELDRRRGALVRRDARHDSSSTSTVLVGQVREVMFSLDTTEHPADAPILTAQIESDRAVIVRRRYILP